MVRRRWAWLLLAGLLVTGCWDRREIEERSLVLASGFDPCAEEAEEPCAFRITRQIAIPGRIPLGPGEGPGSDQQTVEVITVPAESGPQSHRTMQAMLNREMRFGHIRVVIFAEDFARRGLAEVLDYTHRVPEAHRLFWVLVSVGPSEAVIRARPELEPLPAIFLNDMLQDAVSMGRLPPINIGEFMIQIANRGEDPVAPLIRMAEPDLPELSGLAVFRGTQMVGTLSPEESVTYLQVRGVKRASERLEVSLPNDRRADLDVFSRRSQYQLSGRPGRLQVRVRIDLEANLSQASPAVDTTDGRTLTQIEERAARQVEESAARLAAKLQALGADVFAVGERVRAYMPGVWRQIPDWHQAFAGVRFQFEVKVSLRRTGMAME